MKGSQMIFRISEMSDHARLLERQNLSIQVAEDDPYIDERDRRSIVPLWR